MVFETDSGIRGAIFDHNGILMDSFYIERNNLNPEPDIYLEIFPETHPLFLFLKKIFLLIRYRSDMKIRNI